VSIFDENRSIKRQNTGFEAILGPVLAGVVPHFFDQKAHKAKAEREEHF
jgi:hypothetical protein